MSNKDEVVDIPATMEKYFRGGGQMVKPSIKTVFQLVSKIPEGKVATLGALRERIAKKHKVHTACPAATMKSLKEAIKTEKEFGYWRIVKNDGQFIGQFPGGIDSHMDKLQEEGFDIDNSKKNPILKGFTDSLHNFR